VDVKFQRQFKRMITLDELKAQPELDELAVVRKGNRLSINPVGKAEWDFIVALE
jgi:predicted RNA-binding protein with PUA-like domain